MDRRKLLKGIASAALLPFIPKIVKDISPASPSLPNFAMMLPVCLYKHDADGEGVYFPETELYTVGYDPYKEEDYDVTITHYELNRETRSLEITGFVKLKASQREQYYKQLSDMV